ncbi:metal ABC transporter permease [candidate division KSB1 bacterium]|nr:metal ABC transporter permease [candidate division KSB1 bacterium]MBL7095649.1 metal ABC transporter permease [candidate division KSB1 bacterium]
MPEILQYEFMRNAFYAAILVSIACGIVGTFVVIKKIVFISGGITHAAFGGIGLGYFLGINPVIAAIPFSLLSAIGIGLVGKKIKLSEDSAIGIIWSVGMAIGIVFISLTPGYAPDLFSYLFGSILTVSTSDIFIMLLLDFIIIVVVLLMFKEFQALAFDEEFSSIVGVPTKALYLLLLSLVALSIIVLIRVVGVILVIALLTIPTVIARQFTNKLKKLMLYSTICAVILTIAGLWLSYLFDLPSGATIVLVLAFVFLISSFISKRIVRKSMECSAK